MKKITLMLLAISVFGFFLSCQSEKASAPAPKPVETSKYITKNQTGTFDGYFFSFWTNGGGTVSMTVKKGGNYTCTWSNAGDFTCGTGWYPGSDRTINYKCATWDITGSGYLAVYGWTTLPLVEYYIVENWGNFRPTYSTKGTLTSDGATYEIYTHEQVDQPSINGTATFMQYWSVRQTPTETGKDNVVTTANHFKAWKSKGLEMGRFHYQIMLTEGFGSGGGYSDVTCW